MKFEYILIFVIVVLIPFGFPLNDERAQYMVQEVVSKGYKVKDYTVPYIESGPFFRSKGCIIVKMTTDDDLVIWGRSGFFL